MAYSNKKTHTKNDYMIGTLKINTITNVCPLITEYSNTNIEIRDIIDKYGFPYFSSKILHYLLYFLQHNSYEIYLY